MDLYQYSEDHVTVMNVRWLKLKLVMAGMIISWCLMAAGGLWLVTAEPPIMLPWNRAAHQENSILRDQIRSSASGMQSMEISLLQIHSEDARLTILLGTQLSSVDSLARQRAYHDPILKHTSSFVP